MLSARLNLSPPDCKDSIEREFNNDPVKGWRWLRVQWRSGSGDSGHEFVGAWARVLALVG